MERPWATLTRKLGGVSREAKRNQKEELERERWAGLGDVEGLRGTRGCLERVRRG